MQKIYCPSTTNRRVTADDFKATPAASAKAATSPSSFDLTAMIEYARTSTHLATLRSSLKMIREANHPNVRPMLDFFHFWSGMSKFEDLDMIRPGEIAHVHFQDILDTPRELIDNNGRVIPGDGNAPVVKILQKLEGEAVSGRALGGVVPERLTAGDAAGSRRGDQAEVRKGDAGSGGVMKQAFVSVARAVRCRVRAAAFRSEVLDPAGSAAAGLSFEPCRTACRFRRASPSGSPAT